MAKEDILITFKQSGNFNKLEKFLQESKHITFKQILERYAQEGVEALSLNTPIDSGLTSMSWKYEIIKTSRGYIINWLNSNIVDGVPVAILLQYGHGTRSGTFIEGIDYINPAIRPIFEKISENLWKEVTNL